MFLFVPFEGWRPVTVVKKMPQRNPSPEYANTMYLLKVKGNLVMCFVLLLTINFSLCKRFIPFKVWGARKSQDLNVLLRLSEKCWNIPTVQEIRRTEQILHNCQDRNGRQAEKGKSRGTSWLWERCTYTCFDQAADVIISAGPWERALPSEIEKVVTQRVFKHIFWVAPIFLPGLERPLRGTVPHHCKAWIANYILWW